MAERYDFYVHDNRKITFNLTEPIMREDNHVTDWVIHIPKTLNELEVSEWSWCLVYVNANGEKRREPLELSDDPESPLEKNIGTYSVDYGMSIKAGTVLFAIEGKNADTSGTVLNEWHTYTYEHKVKETIQGDDAEYDDSQKDVMAALIVQVQTKMNQVIGGATPTPVASVSAMTDPSKLYLLTTDGEWYYHNGTQFVSGGVYGAGIVDSVPTQGSTNAVSSGGVYEALQNIDITTDTTLSVSGKPADAKVVGDEFFSDTSTETPIALTTTVDNWRLKTDGYAEQNASYNLKKYQVTAGDTIKVVSDDYFQFQTSASVPTSGTQSIVGETYTTGTFTLEVPATVTYLIVSTPKTNSQATVFNLVVGERVSKIGALTDRLDAIDTATTSDVGKVLKAKTVTDGKVAEWEFGDSEAVEELQSQMQTVVSTSYDYSGNLADTTGAVKTGQYTNYVEFDLVGDGTYYSNPYALGINTDSSAKYEVYLLDANGETITATRTSDGTTKTNIGFDYSKIRYTFNGANVTVAVYLPNGNVNTYEYTLSATPVKVKYRTRWWDADKAQINGFTYGYSSETYVSYSAPSKVYSPNPDFLDEIKDYYVADGFIDKTLSIEESAADAKVVGDELYDRKGVSFDTVTGWIKSTNGALITDSNYTATDYIPVTPGEVIRVNRPSLIRQTDNAFYGATKSYVSGLTTPLNINDVTVPSNAYYVRFSDMNSGMVGFSVERTGLWTRIRDAITESGGESEYRNLIEQSRYGNKVLTLLHFSDLHMDANTMGFINAFRTKYAEFLDDVIQTGDVSNGFSNDWSALVSLGLGDCLGVIGNHEALGSSKNSATQQELHEKYIEPYISGWNVTQPTGVDDNTSEHYCANYYYKDYTSATIRLIVLDTQKWSSAQLAWFTDVLASARTAGYAVVVASHVLPGAVTITDCNFSAKYSNSNNVTHAFPTSDAPLATEDAVSAVNDFITAGGEFTIWIGGHEHADIFGVFTNYPNVTAYMIDKASIERETPGAARIRGEKNQHAFNIMSIVRDGKLIKFVRIGEDVDGMMRGKHVFCYSYNTKTIISQW